MMRYLMHDWQSGECVWETSGCTPPDGVEWDRMYIQSAIDSMGADPCPVCIGDREPKIAYDIWVEPVSP